MNKKTLKRAVGCVLALSMSMSILSACAGKKDKDAQKISEITYKEILAKDSSAYNKDTSNGMAYNGIPTIKKKCQYVKDNGYGGIMIWELGQDSTTTKYSLLNAIKEVLYGSAGAR